MGALVSTRNEGKARSDAIDREIEAESRNRCRKVNMLLLGTDPECSMIIRRMKIQHGLTNDELLQYRLTIYQNSLDSAQALIRAMQDMEIGYTDPSNHVKANQVLDYRIQHGPSFVFSAEIAEAIHGLWQNARFMDGCSEFSLGGMAEYFCEEIIRIGSPDYLPIDSDILQARQHLSRLTETHLNFDAFEATIVDSARTSVAKWIHYFENITYILFCVSLSDYDHELHGQNQFGESLIVFDSVVHSRWFPRTSIILLLTNIDAFENKLSKVPLERYFPDYAGGSDFNKAIEYMKSRFMQVNQAKLAIYFIQHRAMSTTIDSISGIVKGAILEDISKNPGRAPLRVLRWRPTFSPARSLKSRRFWIL